MQWPESLLNDLAQSCGDLVRRAGHLSALTGCVSIAPHLRHVRRSIDPAAVSSSPPRLAHAGLRPGFQMIDFISPTFMKQSCRWIVTVLLEPLGVIWVVAEE